MNEHYNYLPQDDQSHSYRTGSTQPPKKHRGIIAALLVAVIFLGGIVSALGIMNVRLFSQLQAPDSDDGALSFLPSDEDNTDEEHNDNSSQGNPAPDGSAPELVLQDTPQGVENIPQEGGLSLQSIYEQNIPSVVSISCDFPNGSGSGTGVVLSENGYLVTNSHVVSGATDIRVLFTDERHLPASLVGADPVSDLAVLYVDAADLTPAQFGNSQQLRVGDSVVAIGDPLGTEFRGTMTDGIVSAINRDVESGNRTMTLIQTNAALNSGNSGGPLINCYGQVIGINTMKIGAFSDSAGVEGLGFAIPSATVKEIVDQLIRQGHVSGRPDLGITGERVSEAYQLYYHLPAGVLVRTVEEAGAAEKAGIAPGDIILAVESTRVTDPESLNEALYAYNAGDTVTLTVQRSRKQFTLRLTLQQAGGE